MKKSAILLFIFAMVLASVGAMKTSRASGTATISIDSTTQQFPSAHIGDTINVNISVSNVQNLGGWDIAHLKFDPTALNLTQVTEGPFLKQAGQTLFIWSSQSTVSISEGDVPDINCILLEQGSASGSGVIATLTFQIVSVETSQINFTQTTLEGPYPSYAEIDHSAINSNITVVPEFPSWLVIMLLLTVVTISLFFSKKVNRRREPM